MDIENKSETLSDTQSSVKLKVFFYGKSFIIISVGFSLIWLLGYLQINILWGILGILTFIIYQISINEQRQKFKFGVDLSQDIKYTLGTVSNLPSWVSFPDVESVEWINTIILRLWPNITVFMNKIIRDTILKKIQKKLKGLKLKDINFGDVPPKIGGVKIYNNENISRDEIIIDVDIYYLCPGEINFVYNQIPCGIKNFEVKGHLRVQINSLIPQIPFFGAISLTLLQNPHVNFEFTDAVAIFNMPGLRVKFETTKSILNEIKNLTKLKLSRNSIERKYILRLRSFIRESLVDLVADEVVLPNRICIPIKKDINKVKFMYHIPEGVLRINVIEALSLKAMDIRIFEHNTSDPYIIIRVGAEKFKSKTINNNLNPKWNETFEAIVDTKSCQTVELEVNDKDKNNKDDFLGSVSFDVQSVYDRGIFDTWLQLEGVDTGSVHLNLTWLDLSSEPDAFDLEEDRIKCNEFHCNIGFLYISIDSAKNLYKPSLSEDPDPYVKLSLGNETFTSKVKKRTINPVWEDPCRFMFPSLLSSVLSFQVKDEKSKKTLGTYSFKVENLRNEPNMEGLFTLKLENTNSTGSTIQVYIVLRALVAKKTRTSTFSRIPSMKLSRNTDSNPDVDSVGDAETDVIKPDINDDVFLTPLTKTLDQNDNSNIEKSSVNIALDSRVYLTLRYTANRNMFIVAVHTVENIKTDHPVYVKLSMHSKDIRNTKRQTKAVRHQNKFVYDETFEFILNKEDLEQSELKLNFKVERHSLIKRNPVIGRTMINLSDFNPNVIKSNWYPIDLSKCNRNGDTISLSSNKSEILIKEKNV